jgi:plastocyanin domain-containing protein
VALRGLEVEGAGVHGVANPGEVTSMEFTPTQPGVYQINCGMQMMDPGYLIVQ